MLSGLRTYALWIFILTYLLFLLQKVVMCASSHWTVILIILIWCNNDLAIKCCFTVLYQIFFALTYLVYVALPSSCLNLGLPFLPYVLICHNCYTLTCLHFLAKPCPTLLNFALQYNVRFNRPWLVLSRTALPWKLFLCRPSSLNGQRKYIQSSMNRWKSKWRPSDSSRLEELGLKWSVSFGSIRVGMI